MAEEPKDISELIKKGYRYKKMAHIFDYLGLVVIFLSLIVTARGITHAPFRGAVDEGMLLLMVIVLFPLSLLFSLLNKFYTKKSQKCWADAGFTDTKGT